MARISTYALDTSISNNDKLVGTDAEDSNITKNYKIDAFIAFVSGNLNLQAFHRMHLVELHGASILPSSFH